MQKKAEKTEKNRMRAVKKGIFALLCMVLLAGIMPGKDVQAASAKKKAMKAYASFLAKHPSKTFKNYGDAGFSSADKSYVNSYFLSDMDKNGVPELFTYTNVNFRWFIVRVYTYKNGKVTLCKFADGSDAEFNNNASANGSYNFYICKKKHIHNAYSGGMESNEFVYKGAKSKLKTCFSYQEVRISYPAMIRAYKGGTKISAKQYAGYTKNCAVKKLASYKNSKKNRSTLKKGKAKVN